MARIEYTGLVSQIRGKIAGTVFSKFQGGYSAYRKGSPRKQGSQAQQLVRNYFYAFAAAWKTLTETQRNDWRFVAANTPLYDRLGILRPINGFAYFVKFNQFLAGFMPTPQVSVTTDLEPAYPTSIIAAPATFSISPTGWILDDLEITLTTLGNSVYPNLALVYFSQPIPYNDIVYHGTWYKAAAVPIAANIGASEEIPILLEDVVMPAGFRSNPGALHMMKVVMIAIDSAQFASSALGVIENEIPPSGLDINLIYDTNPENSNIYTISPGFVENVSFYFERDNPSIPNSDLTWEMRYRGYTSSNIFVTDEDTLVPFDVLRGNASYPNIDINSSFFARPDLYNWMNDRGPVWRENTPFTFHSWTIRLKQISTGLTTDWINLTIEAVAD
jgi:hypothetical protein